jgi:hypothetical protein
MIVGNARESRKASQPLPGDNPMRLTAQDVATAVAVQDRLHAERLEARRVWGEHPFVVGGLKTGSTTFLCATCKRQNDGIVHQPTWGTDPEGNRKPGDVRFRNELMTQGVPEAEATAWVDAWKAEAARQNIQENYEYWHLADSWVSDQKRNGRTLTSVS